MRPNARSADPVTEPRDRKPAVTPVRSACDRDAWADFAPFADLGALVLAVSGGPDSMALLHLADTWRRALGHAGPTIHVATVDHGLRREAAAEAALVATVAGDYGLPHATLAWRGDKPATRIQERARAARYALLADHARVVGARHILTAHHADDQAETIVMRLGRGSGIGGLAGMRDCLPLADDISICRPLLGWTKADLVELCETHGLAFVRDPSNEDLQFARARLRAGVQALESAGLDRSAMVRFGRRMARAEAALEAEAERVELMLGRPLDGDAHVYALSELAAVPTEIRLRLLGRLVVRRVPGATLRLERLERLAERLFAALDAGRAHKATIAGAILSLSADRTLVLRQEGLRRRGAARG